MKKQLMDSADHQNANRSFNSERRSFLRGAASLCAGVSGFCMWPGALNAKLLEVGVNSDPPAKVDPSTTLWYTAPATQWLEALPLGNGHLGVMVFGGTSSEQFVLNEDTLYAEEPGGRDLPLDITKDFDEVVSLIKQGEYVEANDIVSRKWLGRSWPCYQPLGNLKITFQPRSEATSYRRQLTLSDAVHRVQYVQDGIFFERETFVSAPDNVVVCRLHADKSQALNFKVNFDSPHPTAKASYATPREVVLAGQLPGFCLRRTLEWVEQMQDTWKYPEVWNKDGSRKPFAKQILYGDEVDGRGMRFEARLRALECDGKTAQGMDGLEIAGAQDIVFALAMASSFNGYTKSPSRQGVEPSSRTLPTLSKLAGRSYAKLRDAHVADYQPLFQRATLEFEGSSERGQLPTDQRRMSYSGALDPSMAALFFHYGRYLLIACSRPGTQPANLQGLWNVDRIPPWAGAYTVNINMQMNYWGAETANLSECHEPLIQFMREMSVTGSRVAHDMYHRPGWVMHHNTTLWRDAQPVDWNGYIAFWPMGGGWLCQHLWEHYQFTGDRRFLRETAYPIMKGAAEFYDSWLIENDNGQLLTPVSDSPENQFYYTDRNGKQQMGGITMGCTLDMAIIRELFTNTIAAAKLLNVDSDLATHLAGRKAKLFPYQIGSRGQLLEWFKEFKELPPRHNTSPYYPLYPSNQITPRGTPQLADAEEKLLVERAKKGGGFPASWMAAAWARLNQAETGHGYLERLIGTSTHPNLLNGHGEIFQIDANLGAVAATIEFLMQSHAGEIELLPALPTAWNTGRAIGLRARGGFEVDLEWKEGKLLSVRITSRPGTSCTLRYGAKTLALNLKPGETKVVDRSMI